MNAHERFEDQLPLYAAGTLPDAERAALERHLVDCAACRADLALWGMVSTEIRHTSREAAAPAYLIDGVLSRVGPRRKPADAFKLGWQILRSQARLVQRELWPASAAVMLLGAAMALLANKTEVIYFLAPMIAAACLAVIYGPEHDPGVELALATPTSPWKILLARLTLVSGYNLLITLAASAALLAFVPAEYLGGIILTWLGPLTFLSALALLLSLWLGTANAIMITYGLWLLQYQPFKMGLAPAWEKLLVGYQQFWQSTALLLILAIVLAGAALWSAARRGQPLDQQLA